MRPAGARRILHDPEAMDAYDGAFDADEPAAASHAAAVPGGRFRLWAAAGTGG
jgi:hypothetical protein